MNHLLSNRIFIRFGIGVFVISIISEFFIRYRGNNASYYEDINSGALNSINYINDIYVDFYQIIFSSPIYFLSSLYPINFNNDVLGFIVFTFFGLIGIYFLYKVIEKILKDTDFLSKLLILIIMISIDYAYVQMVQTSPISTSIKPTIITQSLTFVMIYLCMTKRFTLGSVVCGFMILSNAKMSWLILIIYSFWFLINFFKNNIKISDIFIYFFPFCSALFILYGFGDTSFSENELLQIVTNRNGNEDLFIYQHNITVILYMILKISGYVIIYKHKENIDNFIVIGYLVSTIISISGIIYQFFLLDIFPSSSIILMSFVRNSNLVFIFWFLIFLSTFNKILPKNTLAAALTFVAVVFSRSEIVTFLTLISVILIACFANNFQKSKFFQRIKRQNYKKYYRGMTYGLLLVFCSYNIIQALYKFENNVSKDGFKYFQKWTAGEGDEIYFKSLKQIKSDKNNYLFLDLTKKGNKKISSVHGKFDINGYKGFRGLLPRTEINTLVNKGKFIGDFAHFYKNPILYSEHQNRVLFIENLIEELSNSSVSENTLMEIKKYNLYLHINRELIKEENLSMLICKDTYENYALCSA